MSGLTKTGRWRAKHYRLVALALAICLICAGLLKDTHTGITADVRT